MKAVTSPSFLEWMSQSISANRRDRHYLGLSLIGVAFIPPMLLIQHTIPDSESRHLRGQSSGLQPVSTGIESVLEELSLIAQHLDLSLDAAEGIFIPTDPLHLCQCHPIVQLRHGLPEVMEVLGGASEHVMEPSRHDLNRVKALIVGGGIQVDDAGFLALFLACQ